MKIIALICVLFAVLCATATAGSVHSSLAVEGVSPYAYGSTITLDVYYDLSFYRASNYVLTECFQGTKEVFSNTVQGVYGTSTVNVILTGWDGLPANCTSKLGYYHNTSHDLETVSFSTN